MLLEIDIKVGDKIFIPNDAPRSIWEFRGKTIIITEKVQDDVFLTDLSDIPVHVSMLSGGRLVRE